MSDEPEEVAEEAVEVHDVDVDQVADQGEDQAEARVAEPEWDEDVEFEARTFGWKPKSEWAGEVPRGFIEDPRRFMERAEQFGPFKKVRESLRKLESMQDGIIERARKQERAQYEAKLAEFQRAEEEAFDNGDKEAFQRIRQAREGIRPPEQFAQPQEDPVAPLAAEHPWVNDPFLKDNGARLIDIAIRGGKKFASPAEQVKFAESELKRYYPHMFAQPEKPKAKASPVEGGGIGPGRKTSGFDSLPSEAKSAFKSWVAKGVYADTKEDRDEYFREYDNA